MQGDLSVGFIDEEEICLDDVDGSVSLGRVVASGILVAATVVFASLIIAVEFVVFSVVLMQVQDWLLSAACSPPLIDTTSCPPVTLAALLIFRGASSRFCRKED